METPRRKAVVAVKIMEGIMSSWIKDSAFEPRNGLLLEREGGREGAVAHDRIEDFIHVVDAANLSRASPERNDVGAWPPHGTTESPKVG